jgi:hypothetical protein
MTAPSAFPRVGNAGGRTEVESGEWIYLLRERHVRFIRRDLFLSVHIPVAPASDIPVLFLALHHSVPFDSPVNGHRLRNFISKRSKLCMVCISFHGSTSYPNAFSFSLHSVIFTRMLVRALPSGVRGGRQYGNVLTHCSPTFGRNAFAH